MPIEDAEKKMLERHLGQGPGRSIDAEIAKLTELSPANRDLVLTRLKVIDALADLGRPTRDDVDRAAKKLGMGRANLYRLLTRVREEGPVVGITPHARSAATTSAAKQGLPPIAERAMTAVLAERPDAPLLDVLVAIERAYKGSRTRMPSEATVRRRLAVVRRPGGFSDKDAWKADRKFGRKVLIDQCAVSSEALKVDANVAIVFIVDVETRLVIGCGQSPISDQSPGLRRAIDHAAEAAATFVVGRFDVEPGPESVRWVVPDDLLQHADEWAPLIASEETIATLVSGSRRHGQQLVRLMGREFDTFTLMPRVIGEGLRREPLTKGAPPPDLSDKIREAADRWNYRILEAASGMEPTLDGAEQARRMEEWRALQHAHAVKAAIETIIGPIDAALSISSQKSQKSG